MITFTRFCMRYFITKKVLILVASLFVMAVISAQWTTAWARPLTQNDGTTVSGAISVDTTWTVEKSPYKVTGFVRVLPGATLTIQPGVVVEVANAVTIGIGGRLVAEGTPDAPILFTGATKARGSWYGIYVGNTAETPASVSFRHVIVEYGGMLDKFDGANLSVGGAATITIHSSTFRQGGGNGINVATNGSLQISDSAFLENQLAAMRLAGVINQAPIFSNLRAEGNGANVVLYSSANLVSGTLTLTQAGPTLPYRFQGPLIVDKDSHLIVQPGVAMEIESGFSVYGELTALGNAEQPILFTRLNAESANWLGLNITGGYQEMAQAQLDHVIIEYGGRENGANGFGDGSLIVRNATVTVTHSILRAGGSHGITIYGSPSDRRESIYVADTEIANHLGSAIRCVSAACRQTIENVSASGNGFDGIAQQGLIFVDMVWENFGLPYLIEQYTGISAGTLTIEPGSEIRFAQDSWLNVSGNLIAIGRPDAPILFTGSQKEPGWWRSIYINGRGHMIDLRYCEVSYGGAVVDGKAAALLTTGAQSAIFVSDCYLHHGAGPAVKVGNGSVPTFRYNRIEENGFGFFTDANGVSTFAVDARYNWWGAANGPTHSTNPNGTGAAVSDRVRFDPWLTSPGQSVATGLEVTISGVDPYVSGRTESYGVRYANNSGETLQDAVLRVALPANSTYVDSTGVDSIGKGIFWPERKQLFWKLGDLAPGTSGYVAFKMQYDWGLPGGLNAMIAAQLSGSNITPQPFDLAPYLDYQPRSITSVVELSKEQVEAERAANPDLDALYTLAANQGYLYGSAEEQSYNTGDVVKQTILLKFEPQISAFILWAQAGSATGIAVDGSTFTVYRGGGALRYELQTDAWQEVTTAAVSAAGISWNECMSNCIEEKVPSYIVKKYIKILGTVSKVIDCVAAAKSEEAKEIAKCTKLFGKVIPGYGEAVDLGLCNSDCQTCEQNGQGCDDDSCHCCTQDKYSCGDDGLYSIFGLDTIKRKPCNPVTHQYQAEEVVQVCAICDKCIVAANGPTCVPETPGAQVVASQLQPAYAEAEALTASTVVRCDECTTARDPNEMHGPEGDLLPGQLLTYTIDYENVGEGEAYGVFIVNEISEHFDLATLQLPDGALVAAASHTIYFTVGELAPKDQTGSKGRITYSVRLKSGLPSGTVVTNRAVVHFPSVPEETPTNVVVNTVQPIVVTPLALETAFGKPLTIQLQGKDVSNSPLTFAVKEGLFYGSLTGTPPNLTYQPAPGFSGLDRFLFTASNGVETSPPAEVTILVGADTNDSTPPTVLWTAPNDGAVVGAPVLLASGNGAALYTPRIQIQFSEAMDAGSVTSATIQIKEPSGRVLSSRVNYDPSIDQAVVLLQEAAQAETLYTVVVLQSAADLAGNRLAADYQWSFQVGEGLVASKSLFLPSIQN